MPILAAGSQAASWGIMVLYVVLIIGFMYFLAIKPQKKQEKKQKEVMDAVAVGDSILTTSGFYGMVIDVTDDTVIVEFGGNKNCRIPMQKSAIVDVEKLNSYYDINTIILKIEVKVFMRFKVYKHLFSVLAMLMAMLMMSLGMAFFSIRKIKR